MPVSSDIWVVKMHARMTPREGFPRDEFREFRVHHYPEDGSIAVFELLEQRARKTVRAEVLVPRAVHVSKETGKPYNGLYFETGAKFKLPVGLDRDSESKSTLAAGDSAAAMYEFVITKTGSDLAELQYYLRNPPVIEGVQARPPSPPPAPKEKSPLEIAIGKIRNAIRTRTGSPEEGAIPIHKLGKHFRIVDDSGDGQLNLAEFEKALREYGLFDALASSREPLSDAELNMIFEAADADGQGTICYEEFLAMIRGEMNEFRRNLVRLAFNRIDTNRNGEITPDELKKLYRVSGHPRVVSGEWTEDEAIRHFAQGFEGRAAGGKPKAKDGVIDWNEFREYYDGVSASIDNDQHFAMLMEKAWGVRPQDTMGL